MPKPTDKDQKFLMMTDEELAQQAIFHAGICEACGYPVYPTLFRILALRMLQRRDERDAAKKPLDVQAKSHCKVSTVPGLAPESTPRQETGQDD